MRDACIKSVEAAIGRNINQAEARNIEGRIRNAMLQGAREDPAAWRALSPTDRLKEAGKRAAQELLAEAAKAKQRIGMAVLAKQNYEGWANDQAAAGADRTKVKSLSRRLRGRNDWHNNIIPVEQDAKGIFKNAIREMETAVDALRPGIWKLIPWSNKQVQDAFYDALHGVKGPHIPPEIQKAADTYHEVIEGLTDEFNSLGGAVGKLENRGMPHSWSDRIANKRGRDAFVNDFMRFVDRSKYVNDDGALKNDAEMRAWLEEAWLTVATRGYSKDRTSPGPGGSIKANRHRHHREIHLKPEFAREALYNWSDRSALDAIVNELRQLSRDIALLRAFGPNPDNMFQMLLKDAVQDTSRQTKTKGGVTQALGAGEAVVDELFAKSYYDYLAGNVAPPANRPLADFMASWRSVEVIRKLLGSPVSMLVTDPAYLHLAAHANRLNHFKVIANQALAFSPKSRRYLRRLGLLTETVIAHADRFANDYVVGRELAGRFAGESLRAAGANFVTEVRRTGFSVTMMDTLGHLTRRYQDVGKLKADDWNRLAQKGIDQETWDIWRAARLDRWGANHTLLTPEAIMAVPGHDDATLRRAVQKLMAVIAEEEDIAVIQPGVRERVNLGAGTQAGTPHGEIARSIAQFKSFPYSVLTRHWEMALNAPGRTMGVANRYWATGALALTSWFAGTMLLWLWDIYRGKDPRSINPQSKEGVRNLIAGFLRGGGGGIWADFLFSETRDFNGAGFVETAAGPQAATIGETARYTLGNTVEALQGEETNIGSETVRGLRSWAPNFHYTQTLMDHYVWNQLAEAADPGYINRMQRRRERTYGESYWWGPGEAEPERAPDFSNVIAAEPMN